MVAANSTEIEEEVPSAYIIDMAQITFEKLLGSGSFGDCYKATITLGRKGINTAKQISDRGPSGQRRTLSASYRATRSVQAAVKKMRPA